MDLDQLLLLHCIRTVRSWWGGATRPDQLQTVWAPSAHLKDLTSALVDFVSRYLVQPGQRLQQNGGCMGLCVLCVTFESAKKQYISFTYVCMYMYVHSHRQKRKKNGKEQSSTGWMWSLSAHRVNTTQQVHHTMQLLSRASVPRKALPSFSTEHIHICA